MTSCSDLASYQRHFLISRELPRHHLPRLVLLEPSGRPSVLVCVGPRTRTPWAQWGSVPQRGSLLLSSRCTFDLSSFQDESLDGSDFISIDTSSGHQVFVGSSYSMTGMIKSEEPGVWGSQVRLLMTVSSFVLTVKQHTEGRLADSRSMMDLSVDGLDAVDSVARCTGCRSGAS